MTSLADVAAVDNFGNMIDTQQIGYNTTQGALDTTRAQEQYNNTTVPGLINAQTLSGSDSSRGQNAYQVNMAGMGAMGIGPDGKPGFVPGALQNTLTDIQSKMDQANIQSRLDILKNTLSADRGISI